MISAELRHTNTERILTKDALCVFAMKKKSSDLSRSFGAAGRIRTADLILTKDALYLLSYSSILATEKGLEPSTSSVTGWRSNQLNYSAKFLLIRFDRSELNYYNKYITICQYLIRIFYKFFVDSRSIL